MRIRRASAAEAAARRTAPSRASTPRGSCSGSRPASPTRSCAAPFEPGDAVVLYTDGVVEARRDGELYGEERLDKLLADNRELPAAGAGGGRRWPDCRRWVGGDLRDDCAIVVVRRL